MKIAKISEKTESSLSQSPEQIFEEAIELLGKDGAFKKGDKALVLMLDDTSENFRISYLNAGMKCSQVISLLDCAKSLFRSDMGY